MIKIKNKNIELNYKTLFIYSIRLRVNQNGSELIGDIYMIEQDDGIHIFYTGIVVNHPINIKKYGKKTILRNSYIENLEVQALHF